MDNFRDYTEGADEPDLLNASAALIREGRALDEATRQELAEYDDGLDNTLFLLDADLNVNQQLLCLPMLLNMQLVETNPKTRLLKK